MYEYKKFRDPVPMLKIYDDALLVVYIIIGLWLDGDVYTS